MYARTDHETGKYWPSATPGTFKQYFADRAPGSLSFTVEFSRFKWWNRSFGAYVPTEDWHARQFARDAVPAINEFFGGRPAD
jgi:hypothetical protein